MAESDRSSPGGPCGNRSEELKNFTETGEASDDLLAHLEVCPGCEEAAIKAFSERAASLAELRRILMAEEGVKAGRAWPVVDRSLKVLLACALVGVGLLLCGMVAKGYAVMRDQEISRGTTVRAEALFPGALDAYCDADPAALCYFGGETSACAEAAAYPWLPFPAPTKVYCQFNSWPKPDPQYGAAFLVVEGTDIVGYRYANCANGPARALMTAEGGVPLVRRFPGAGAAADECGSGPRVEVSRWRLTTPDPAAR